MNIKALGALAAVALLAACSNAPKTQSMATGSGTTAAQSGPAPGSEQQLVADVGDRAFFGFNKSNLTGADKSTLDRQASWLAKYPNVDVLIAGNADPRGTETYNLALGARRAHAARNYLVAKGVAASRIRTISYGKSCLVSPGNTQQDYAQDRVAITSVQGFNPQHCH
ncbi:MAG: peptidoglycan-associated lipoprotein [Acidiphilium sp. 37-67-22]|jgi:peptidoglycan-associated lipoprotein|uniref:OmpA family protein n=1 Tax=unclassified Acidiphilium TaxID=2617493 RepID=UPI000BCD6BED|nr:MULTISPECIES: OmpA family protein [unclassified Acidiphilium]OYV84670.1 MAG: peptidoglycan-associated lipoprotein [Acidiphilium sp. 21-68-69]OYW09582.1 MAG: peptidoglycan-associated lipoprotein [Acidiphilium sp. 37-67-22]OYV55814.1 MAG: peptidoglycan-associated lipoprotein [Acidiphilium sp. 20-67-58]HQT60313.1 OmpA family protein [Acidiphilium sp.]HQT72872.1 OmpA family protein [Acidiphilium sp.]